MGRLSQLKDRVASTLNRDDDEPIDQQQARVERARVEARREARREKRRQEIEQAREEGRNEVLQDGSPDSLLDRAADALESASTGNGGGEMDMSLGFEADDSMDAFGDSGADDPFAESGLQDPGAGGYGAGEMGSDEDIWGEPSAPEDEQDALESMGFTEDDFL